MSNTKRYIETIDALRECSQTLCEIAGDLERWFGSPAQDALPAEPDVQAQPKLEAVPTLEEVRAVLAEKTRAGLTDQVRGLIEKYGAERLSEVNPKDYLALLKDAEVLHVN